MPFIWPTAAPLVLVALGAFFSPIHSGDPHASHNQQLPAALQKQKPSHASRVPAPAIHIGGQKMQVIRDPSSVSSIADPELRTLVQKTIAALSEDYPYDPDVLGYFVIVEPGDSIATTLRGDT